VCVFVFLCISMYMCVCVFVCVCVCVCVSPWDEHGQVGRVSGGAPSVRCFLLLV